MDMSINNQVEKTVLFAKNIKETLQFQVVPFMKMTLYTLDMSIGRVKKHTLVM